MDNICCASNMIEHVFKLAAPVTTTVVLAAVLRNFVLAKGHRPISERRDSLVATASMLAFFGGVYLLIRVHFGVVAIAEVDVRLACELLGVALMVAGCAVNLVGRVILGRNWANQATVYSDQTLVTGGVFSIVRHPLYASLIAMFYGASLLYQNAAVAAATSVIFVPAMYYRASLEERMLSQRFSEYDQYRMHVGRLFPRIVQAGAKRRTL